MSNLPPGVTGNEYEIAGPDWEGDDYRECDAEGFTVRTISLYGKNQIKAALDAFSDPKTYDIQKVALVMAYLRQALGDIQTIDVDGECPFGGDVTISRYQNSEWWECPVCRTSHEKEMD